MNAAEILLITALDELPHGGSMESQQKYWFERATPEQLEQLSKTNGDIMDAIQLIRRCATVERLQLGYDEPTMDDTK